MKDLKKILDAYNKIGEDIALLAEAVAGTDMSDLKRDGIEFVTAMGIAQDSLNKNYSIFEPRAREVEDQIG